jgi:hypothetical protein
MHQSKHVTFTKTLGAALLACLMIASASAQESSDANVPPATASKQASEMARGDPGRWYREDVTPAQRLRTLQKEIGAALQEAQGNCKRAPSSSRASCLKEARATYQQEMAGAPRQAKEAAQLSSTAQ